MSRAAAPAIACALALAPFAARAEPRAPSSCFAAAVDGQKLRNAGKLLAARDALIACSSAACPAEVTRDCTRWLAEVNASTPSIVFAAKDAAGADLADVRVEVDGADAGTTADGRAVPLDPGPHEAVFARPDGARAREAFVARVGDKNRTVVARFAPADGAPARARAGPPAAAPVRDAPRPAARAIPLASIVLGGAGVAALGVFGWFGASGVRDRDRLGCDIGCSAADKRDVDTQFLVADVALGVGVVALASAVVLYFVQPTRSSGD